MRFDIDSYLISIGEYSEGTFSGRYKKKESDKVCAGVRAKKLCT
jgi:hypothetical protein